MVDDYDKPAANLVAGLWGGCINRMIRALMGKANKALC